MEEAASVPFGVAQTRESKVRPRNFAIIGDQAIYTPFSYVDVDCRWTLFSTTGEFMQAHRTSRIAEVDAVVVFSAAPEPIESLTLGSGSIAGLGIPVLYLSASDADTDLALCAWAPGGDADVRARETLPSNLAPRAALARTQEGAGPALLNLGEILDRPWTERERESLQAARYEAPLPVPTGRSYSEAPADSRRRARITTVVSDKGGVGKTTLSLLIGASIAHETHKAGRPQQVLIVDLDRQTQMRELVSRARVGLEKLTISSTREEVLASLYHATADPECAVANLTFLLGATNQAEHLATRSVELYERILGYLQDDFDHIILDGSVGVTSDSVTRWAQQISDDVIYVLEADRIQYGKLLNLYDTFAQPTNEGGLGCDLGRLVLVENRVVMNDAADEEFYQDWDRALERDMPDLVRFSVPEIHPDVRRAFKSDMGVVNMPAVHEGMARAMFPIATFLAGQSVRPSGTQAASEAPGATGRKKRWGLF